MTLKNTYPFVSFAERPPHPATVVQPRRPLAGPPALPPHPATVVQPRGALYGLDRPHAWAPAIQRSFNPISAVEDSLGTLSHEEQQIALKAMSWNDIGGVIGEIEQLRKLGKSKSKGPSLTESSVTSVIDSLDDGSLLSHAYSTNDASDVICLLSSTPGTLGKKIVKAKSDLNDFAMLGQKKQKEETEISVSSGDGEVLVLSAALGVVAGTKDDVTELVLCGPYGPCDGCKQRIAYFAQLWTKTVKSGQVLLIHYIYAAGLKTNRSGLDTYYGDVNDNYKMYKEKQVKKGKTLYIHTWTVTA